MTLAEIELKLVWYFNPFRNIIIPNLKDGVFPDMHECDLLVLHPTGYATEVEIKLNKADILRDKKKKHNHDHLYIRRLFFAVPEELEEFALEHIPERAGLIIVSETKERLWGCCKVVKHPKLRKGAKKWEEKHRVKLLQLMQIRYWDVRKGLFLSKQYLNKTVPI